MPTPTTTVRLDPELSTWLGAYASQRGANKTQVVEAALRAFRELAARGVPELPEAKSSSPTRGSEQASGEGLVSRPATGGDSKRVRSPQVGPAPAEDPRHAARVAADLGQASGEARVGSPRAGGSSPPAREVRPAPAQDPRHAARVALAERQRTLNKRKYGES